MIPNILSIRDITPISNKYHLINNHPEAEFVLALHYLDNHKCRTIIRRIDQPIGGDHELLISIFSNDDSETIKIGQSYDNSLVTIFSTSIKLEKADLSYDQTIPKIIVQTAENNTYKSKLHYNSIASIIDLNPEYEYRFFNHKTRREFIKKNFNKSVLNAYDFLVPGAYKADLFRLCYLYINGGVYIDCKSIMLKPMREWMEKNDQIMLCIDPSDTTISTGIIACQKGISNMMDVIINIVEHVEKQNYSAGALGITGPDLVYKYFHNYPIKLKHRLLNSDATDNYRNTYTTLINSNEKLLYKFYQGYYEGYLSVSHYPNLFRQGQVYYKSCHQIDNYLIFVYPHPYNDRFHFEIENNILSVRRIDIDGGWGQNLKINIINDAINKEHLVIVGTTDSPIMHFHLPQNILKD